MKLSSPAWRGVIALACLALTGCTDAPSGSQLPLGSPSSLLAPTTATSSSPPAPTATPPGTAKVGVPVNHSIKSGGLTVTLNYTASPSVARWTPDGPRSINVLLTAVNNRRPGQKVYLTKATVRFTAGEDPGALPGVDPVTDTANLNPGYLVAYPYRYDQSFNTPALVPGLESLRFDFKYELVTLVDKKAKDYTKQTVNDSVSITLPF